MGSVGLLLGLSHSSNDSRSTCYLLELSQQPQMLLQDSEPGRGCAPSAVKHENLLGGPKVGKQNLGQYSTCKEAEVRVGKS